MKPILAEPIKIITPKKFLLDGLWFGPSKPKCVLIFVHGLGSNAFNNHEFVVPLVDKKTVVITFSNRGHDIITRIRQLQPRSRKGYKSFLAGVAYEVFRECEDDIAGVVKLAKSRGAKKIYLIGHSTGCQKSIYYLSRGHNQKLVKGVILLCPISDYASLFAEAPRRQYLRAVKVAKQMVRWGRAHELMPKKVWPKVLDAQRFLSLYTPDSPEEIFCYSQKNKKPSTFKKITVPILVVFADNDQYSDIPAKELEFWFGHHTKSRKYASAIIPGANHAFYKREEQLSAVLKAWIK